MAQQYKILHPVKYYRDFMSYDIRPDGRDLLKFRPAIVNVGSISTADGSAIVKIGNTTVVCGIKAELAQPKTEAPNKGYLIPNVELPPLCSARFRPGPPSDQAQVTSRLVADIIENFKCIDLTELCITPDKLVWVLYCDLVCLDHDGALTDACVAAILAALKTVTLPEVQYDAEINKKTVLESSRKPLNITNIPISTTYAIFDDSIILADPTSEEENLCTGIVTISISGSQLYSLHKPGGSPLTDEQIDICVEESKKRSKLINNLLNTALSAYEDKRNS